MKIHILLLAGGAGKRLWPLSSKLRSKQSLPLLVNEKGERESMLKRIYRQLRKTFKDEQVVAATSEIQAESIKSQLGDAVEIVIEPSQRDTFGAIALSCSYLNEKRGSSESDIVVVLPIDSYTEDHFFSSVKKACVVASSQNSEIVLVGITPTKNSTRYGYILSEKNGTVSQFVEKPTEERAAHLIAKGALWNGGVFVFRLGYMMSVIESKLGSTSYTYLLEHYDSIEKTSFDYAVVERAHLLAVVPFDGVWKDLGTWQALAEEMREGFGPQWQIDSKESVIFNELPIPVATINTENIVVAASQDGILITDKKSSEKAKLIADKMGEEPRFEPFKGGVRTVLCRSEGYQSNLLKLEKSGVVTILYGKAYRIVLVCTAGEGELSVDGSSQPFRIGDSISINGKKLITLRTKGVMELTETIVQVTTLFP